MSQPSTPADPPPKRGLLGVLGPAVIVASVVLGPGSILTNSKVGTQFGYQMIWILLSAGFLMFALTSFSARLGVIYERSFGDEIAARLGRPMAILIGVTVFLIAACFQFTNNLGVLAAIEPFSTMTNDEGEVVQGIAPWISVVILAALNVIIMFTLFGLKHIYRHLEKIMISLVMVMMAVFVINILFAGPDLLAVFKGLIPSWPGGELGRIWPTVIDGKIQANAGVLVALVATTTSVAGAFYQGYLVKEKGWKLENLSQQRIDSAAGIAVLTGISLIVMLTSAAVLYGTVDPDSLTSATDVAQQLKPLLGQFGYFAEILFCVGIFAGAFSSFLGNAMVGGVLLSDGLGYDCKLSSLPTKICTSLGLFAGMVVALLARGSGMPVVPLIILGQSLTILGLPLLAAMMLYLGTRPELDGPARMPRWMLVCGGIVMLLTLFLATRTGWEVYLKLSLML